MRLCDRQLLVRKDLKVVRDVGQAVFCGIVTSEELVFRRKCAQLVDSSTGEEHGRAAHIWGKKMQGQSLFFSVQLLHLEEIGTVDYKKIIPLEKFTNDSNQFEYHTYLIAVEEEFIPKLNNEHRGYAWTSIADHPKPLHPGVWRTFSFRVIKEKLKTLESIFTDHTLIPTHEN